MASSSYLGMFVAQSMWVDWVANGNGWAVSFKPLRR